MSIEFKRLPRHWAYPLQRKQVKALLAQAGADFRAVQFLGPGGTPSKLTAGLRTAGYLDAHYFDRACCFRLRVLALPEMVLSRASRDLGGLISQDIQAYVSTCLDLLPRTSEDDAMRIFFLRETPNDLVPDFATRRLTGFDKSFVQFDRWWASAPAA